MGPYLAPPVSLPDMVPRPLVCLWFFSLWTQSVQLDHWRGILCMSLLFIVSEELHALLWGVPCASLTLKKFLLWGLVPRTQKRTCIQVAPLPWENILDLHYLWHLAASTFCLLRILVGGFGFRRGYIRVAPATWVRSEFVGQNKNSETSQKNVAKVCGQTKICQCDSFPFLR